jgi:hypothetical protein
VHGEGFNRRGDPLGYKDIFQYYDWMDARISVDDIAKAMTPDVAWHLYPCSIDSHTTYRIIRAYVKDHIDPMQAEITSDYDFCFTVKKKVRIVPYIKKWEIYKDNLKSYRPPRFKNKAVDCELLEVFEMTHAKRRYEGYTVVDDFKGNSLAELAANIDRYLSELMEVINRPLARCPHCEGKRVVDFQKLSPNDRQRYGIAA